MILSFIWMVRLMLPLKDRIHIAIVAKIISKSIVMPNIVSFVGMDSIQNVDINKDSSLRVKIRTIKREIFVRYVIVSTILKNLAVIIKPKLNKEMKD